MHIIKCPVCGGGMEIIKNICKCTQGHCFDMGAKGYLNLLLPNQGSGNHGDSREMLLARRSFLEKGYYQNLSEHINQLCLSLLPKKPDTVIADCCCGEGYYTKKLCRFLIGNDIHTNIFAFDISKAGVKMASSKTLPVQFLVASVFNIPLADESIDTAVHSFAPYCNNEISRILKPGGYLIGILPGKRHLYGLKEILYESPYENDETGYESETLTLVDTVYVKGKIHLKSQEDIHNLFLMTPYFFRTTREGAEKLARLNTLETETEFVIKILQKCTVS